MSVTFFRHSKSYFNIYKDTSRDVGIPDSSKNEARCKMIGNYDIIICSTLRRARETLESSSITYKNIIYTDLCREVLDGNESNLLYHEENITESRETFERRANMFLSMIISLMNNNYKLAVISHGVFMRNLIKNIDISLNHCEYKTFSKNTLEFARLK